MYTVGPWARARAMVPLAESAWNRARAIFATALWLSVLIGAILLARHNLRVNRADRKGAARLAGAYLVMQLAAWIVGAHHLSGAVEEVGSLLRVAGTLLMQCAILWMLYLALEPYGRRFWPDGLLGWTRLLSGRVRDPRIGREILIGCVFAGALMLVDLFRSLSPLLVGRPPGVPMLRGEVEHCWTDSAGCSARGPTRYSAASRRRCSSRCCWSSRGLSVRRTWLAAILGGCHSDSAPFGGGVPPGGDVWLYYLPQAMAVSLIILAIFRSGCWSRVVMISWTTSHARYRSSRTARRGPRSPAISSIALVIGIACFGFYAARAGQPLFGKLEV